MNRWAFLCLEVHMEMALKTQKNTLFVKHFIWLAHQITKLNIT